ncbi:HCL542Wp [Eremothecium sinecaudum]|uniref:HCL542Wp n=1 Tax=Eremothecium sinecaudum TaxID=45286 RepID=A0A120K1P7_9SACH|nr:HCL542Wp [Eremothecium sinecaudum]AMD19609.1 HCL542Wp [Eremothecium sinecaudum]
MLKECEKTINNINTIYSKEERYLLSITELMLPCSLYDELGGGVELPLRSASTTYTSDITSMTKASQYNLWTKQMELRYGEVLENLTTREAIHKDVYLTEDEMMQFNEDIRQDCRGKKVRRGIPPFIFLKGQSEVGSLIDANFLLTDDHEQFHYMQRYKNFPNSNSLEYVKEMIQPYIELMDDMAKEIAERRQRKEQHNSQGKTPASYISTGTKTGSHCGSNSQTKVSSSISSIFNRGPVKKWLTLWSRMKQRIRLLNDCSLVLDTTVRIIKKKI